ncbi:tetratricopeptide repeat protein [Fontivita pretiosa]|uniref:tetratricopeptide repeat protein n=1 Tax=Fontivita pretiosa TaxID=2989684 RepID=UPI003D17F164
MMPTPRQQHRRLAGAGRQQPPQRVSNEDAMSQAKIDQPVPDHAAGGVPAGGGLRQFVQHNPAAANALAAAIILVATLLAYVPAIRGSFIWDDDYHVVNNPLLRSWEGLQRIWFDILPRPSEYPLPQYYPMTHTSFWLEYRLWGLNPAGYHTVNVLLHVCSALLIWLILRKLDVPGSWLAGLIFALHPVNVESVAWISERKNVLSMLFFLSGLYVYLRYAGIIRGRDRLQDPAPKPAAQTDETTTSAPTSIEWFTLPDDPQRLYVLAWVLFACALFSKTITSSFPAVVLLIIWWKRRRITLSDIRPLAPMFAAGIAMGMLTTHMERWRVGVAMRPHYFDLAPPELGALGELGARFIVAGKAVWFYVGKLLWPHPLIFNYPRWQIDATSAAQYLWPISALLVLVAVLVLYRMRLVPAGVVVALLYFGGTLFPAMGFVSVWPMQYSFVADHFVYLSSIGLIALAAGVLGRYLSLEALAGIGGLVGVLCFVLTFNHARVFSNLKTLWEDTLQKTDQKSWMAANNYGVWFLDHSGIRDPYTRAEYAEMWFNKTLRLKPDHVRARLNLARVAIMRAELARAERARAAAATQQAATQPVTTQPAPTPPATTQLALSPEQYYEQALQYYRDAIAAEPAEVDAYYLYGELLRRLGRDDEAVEQFRRAIALYPRHGGAYEALGTIALNKGDYGQAIECFYKAVSIDPKSVYAHAQLGRAMLLVGRVPEGLTEWEQVLELAPNDPTWTNLFGQWMAASGEYHKAIDYLNRSRAIDPRNVEAITLLGVVAAKTGFTAEAQRLFEEALAIDPGFVKAAENLELLRAGKLGPDPNYIASTRAAATRAATTQQSPATATGGGSAPAQPAP